jgi:serine/threonine protein kinase/class 3 adenylate cyclase
LEKDQMFGAYRIQEKLGEGGMGVVYRAWDTQLDRPVAIKTLLAEIGGEPEITERFLREAKAASRLQHPSIVTVYHVGEQDGMRYIVMEMVEGKTLKKLINNQPMEVHQLVNIALQISDALAVAHEKNVIHRDMKSENVMLTPRMQAKILDFGLAKLRETLEQGGGEQTRLTQVGMVVGTVSYMAPEQALGLEVDGRSDVFSLGVVLYEMATGKMSFDAPSAQATLARVLNQDPVSPGVLNPNLPPDLVSLIMDCLRKHRDSRPTAADVHARLVKIEAGLSGRRTASEMRMPTAPPVVSGSMNAGSATAFPTQKVQQATQRVPAAAPGSGSTPRPNSGSMSASAAGQASMQAVAAPRKKSAITPAEPEMQATTADLHKWRAIFQVVRGVRYAISLALLAIPAAFFAYFVINGGLIKAEVVEGTAFLSVVRAIVIPVLGPLHNVLNISTKVEGWDFVAFIAGVAAIIIRHLIVAFMQRIEGKVKYRVLEIERITSAARGLVVTDKAAADRLGMLREYAEAKKILYREKRRLAFLAVDVVGSTKMKVGEDKLSIEHAFAEYKKFIERILNSHNVWKSTWTPDGMMCAFAELDDAVRSGQDILTGLAWFNDGVHHLRTPFNVRCGVNAGEVVFPADRQMEEISDQIIDIAGHMQKYANPGSVWMVDELCSELPDATGFTNTGQQVDGCTAVEWRSSGSGVRAASSMSNAEGDGAPN